MTVINEFKSVMIHDHNIFFLIQILRYSVSLCFTIVLTKVCSVDFGLISSVLLFDQLCHLIHNYLPINLNVDT